MECRWQIPERYGGPIRAAFVPVFSGFGVLILWLASTRRFGAESLPGFAAGMMFLAGGPLLALTVVPPRTRMASAYQWCEFACILLIMLGFATIALWIGIAPGDRVFENKIGYAGAHLSWTSKNGIQGVIGRVLFGLVGAHILYSACRAAISGPPMIRARIERFQRWKARRMKR